MEHYADRLRREINEMQEAHPGLEQLIHELKSIENRPQSDFDYSIEREALRYQAVTKFLKLLKHGVYASRGVGRCGRGGCWATKRGQKRVRGFRKWKRWALQIPNRYV